ncbi:conserved hypothetical protein [Desulfosarcina cetonica]|nr:conserved hypothetical protein [Desulfosarcina cetonica]
MADKNSPKQIDLANHCTSVGFAYFRFDHRGCGDSEGNFQTDTTLEGRTADLVSAARKMSDLFGSPSLPLGLFGSSLGGTVCLTAAGQLMPFSIVTLAAPVQSKTIQLPDNSPQSLKTEVNQNRLQFNIASLLSAIHHILIVHGSDDGTVNIQNAHTIFKLAQAPKKQLILEKGDHRITNEQHQKHYIEEAVQWYLDCFKSVG